MSANGTPPPLSTLQKEQYMMFPGSIIHFLQLLEAPFQITTHYDKENISLCHILLCQSTDLEIKYGTGITSSALFGASNIIYCKY